MINIDKMVIFPTIMQFRSLIAGIILVLCSACTPGAFTPPLYKAPTQGEINQRAQQLAQQTHNLQPEVARLGMIAYYKALQQGLVRRPVLTIVDYSKPSSIRRLWVIDMQTQRVRFNEWVAHGKNSGDLYATHFSNQIDSLKSSLGVFITAPIPYRGKYGYSLRLHGYEPGFNSNAETRAIVMHGASYVNGNYIKRYGQAGLSWGCLALNEAKVQPIIDELKGGSLIFAYANDRNFLQHSTFLKT